jgi:hypothetical protein
MDKDNLEASVFSSVARTQAEHLEMFTAAYCKVTGIDPREAVLVQEQKGLTFLWWFERKEDVKAKYPEFNG